MADTVFKTLVYENPSGVQTILSSPTMRNYWEVGKRKGFKAPQVKIITQKYVNGNVRIVNTLKEPRTVSLTLILTGKSEASRDRYFMDMVDRLMDVRKGDVGKLYITRSDGVKLHLNCAYSSGLDVVDEYKNLSKFTLEFYAADPYFYGLDTDSVYDLSESGIYTLSQTLTLNSGWYLGYGNYSSTYLITNDQYGESEPIYEISGKRDYLLLRNASVRSFIEFENLGMEKGDTLVIDTRSRYKRAYFIHQDGSETSALGYLSWRSVSLSLPIPHGDSYLTIQTDGMNSPLHIKYPNMYLTI